MQANEQAHAQRLQQDPLADLRERAATNDAESAYQMAVAYARLGSCMTKDTGSRPIVIRPLSGFAKVPKAATSRPGVIWGVCTG